MLDGSTRSDTTPWTLLLCAHLEPHGTTRAVRTLARSLMAATSLILVAVAQFFLASLTWPDLYQVSRALLSALTHHAMRV